MQLELPLYPTNSLKAAVDAYLMERAEYIAEATVTDYGERARWLYRAFGGEMRKLDTIKYDDLRRAEREWGPRGKGLMLCTVRKRIVFLLAVMKLAAARGIMRSDAVPPLPQIASDSRRKERFLTLTEYQQLRLALTDRMRALVDCAFWTLSHRFDLWTMQRWMLDPGYTWLDGDGKAVWTGRWWRRNHKNKRCVPCWIPAEKEFLPIMRVILAEPGSRDGLVVGRVASYAKALHVACDRCEIPPCSLMSMRHSGATLLMERTGANYEFVRLVLGHEGAVSASSDGRYRGTQDPTVLTRHYLHASPDSLLSGVLKRTQEFPATDDEDGSGEAEEGDLNSTNC